MNNTSSKNKCGIYKIHCTANNRYYIGSAVKHIVRWNAHRSRMAKGNHTNRHLQNAYKKYGSDSFVFTLIEECSEENLIEREQHHINNYNFEDLMNSSPTATNVLGFKHSDESKQFLSKLAKNRDNEHLEKFKFKKGGKNLFEGKKHSPETIKKLKEIQSNRTHVTGGHNKGIPMADDVKLKVSKSVSKNRRVYGDEIEQKAIEFRSLGWTFKRIAEELEIGLATAHRMSLGKRSQKVPKFLGKD